MEDRIGPFVHALDRELQFLASGRANLPVGTVFFGGGTPSLLPVDAFRTLLSRIRSDFILDSNAEITLEANPNDLNPEYLRGLRDAGLNRISIGMQSADPAELSLFERRHDLDMTNRAVRWSREAGFGNISLDLIFGTPYQTLAQWQQTLEAAINLQPDHVSLYNLELKPGTRLTQQVDEAILPRPDDDLAADMYDLATELLGQAGFEQYEISNWCRPGYEARHNLQYWHLRPYAGLGPGAHGYIERMRYTVIRWPDRYIQVLNEAVDGKPFPLTPAVAKSIQVDRETEMADAIMMGMRLIKKGIVLSDFVERFGVDLQETRQATIEKFERFGIIEINKERLRLTQAGRFLSNALIRELI